MDDAAKKMFNQQLDNMQEEKLRTGSSNGMVKFGNLCLDFEKGIVSMLQKKLENPKSVISALWPTTTNNVQGQETEEYESEFEFEWEDEKNECNFEVILEGGKSDKKTGDEDDADVTDGVHETDDAKLSGGVDDGQVGIKVGQKVAILRAPKKKGKVEMAKVQKKKGKVEKEVGLGCDRTDELLAHYESLSCDNKYFFCFTIWDWSTL